MIFVCNAAIRFLWKSMALKLRVGLRHPDSSVRTAVVKAIGVLAGPSLSPAIEHLKNDVDEGVRIEVVRALKKLRKG
jgi:HEAT repeat protein